jgi:diaminohydroxyphosphoribosylaminopyrimidine deaminase/5-amino-6-(5-phosphoribosylamino)uracil reductase
MDAGQIARKDRLQKKGIRVLETELKDGRIDLEAAIRKLGNLGITSLLIEGGSRVIASALAAGMVDKVCFFYAPRILGGDDGIPICQGAGPASMKDCIAVKDIHVRRFEEDIMIEGYINH